MDPGLKQRLVGAAVLVALAVIFLPMLVQGPAPDSGVSDVPLTMPDAPQGEYETRDLPLVTPGNAPDGGVVGMDSGQPAASASQALPLEGADAARKIAASATPPNVFNRISQTPIFFSDYRARGGETTASTAN